MPLQLNTIEEYDFPHGFHRNYVTGKYIAIQPHDLGRPLTHAEMDYNLILNEQTQAGFRIFGSNEDLTLNDDDLGSSLVFHKISADDDDFAKYQSKGYSVDQYIWILDCCAPKFDCDLFVVDSICSFIVESVTATPEDPCINFVVDSICGNFDIDSISSEDSGGTSPGAVFFNFTTNMFGNDPFIFTPQTPFADVAYTIVSDGNSTPTGPANFTNNHLSGTMQSINATNDPTVFTGIYRFTPLVSVAQTVTGHADVDALVGGYNITSRWYYLLQPAQGGGGKGALTPTPTPSSSEEAPTPTPSSSEVAPTPTPSSSEEGPGIVNFTVNWKIEDNSLNTLQISDSGQRHSPNFLENHTYDHGNQNYMAIYSSIIPLSGYEFTGAANEIGFTLNGTPIVSGGSDLSNNVAMFEAQWEPNEADVNQGAGKYALTLSITGQAQYGADGPIEEGQEFKIEAISFLTAPTPTPSPSPSSSEIPPTPSPSPSSSEIPPTPTPSTSAIPPINTTDAAATNGEWSIFVRDADTDEKVEPIIVDISSEYGESEGSIFYKYFPVAVGELINVSIQQHVGTLQNSVQFTSYSQSGEATHTGAENDAPMFQMTGAPNTAFNVGSSNYSTFIDNKMGTDVLPALTYVNELVLTALNTDSEEFIIGRKSSPPLQAQKVNDGGSMLFWVGPSNGDVSINIISLPENMIYPPTTLEGLKSLNTNLPNGNDRYQMTVTPPTAEESAAGNNYMQFAIQAINSYNPAPGTTVGYTITGAWSEEDIQVMGVNIGDANNISSPVPSVTAESPYSNVFKIGSQGASDLRTAAIRVYAVDDSEIEDYESVRVTLDEYDSTGNMTSGIGVWNTGHIIDKEE